MAAEVYSLVSDQWIISYSGLVGIRLTAIETAFKMLKIHKADRAEIVMKIKRISGVIIRITSEKKD